MTIKAQTGPGAQGESVGRPARSELVEFGVRVSHDLRSQGGSSGYTVEIWHKYDGDVQPRDFAKVNAGNLWTAFQMAVPYMVAAAEPDPFTKLLKEQTRVF